MRCRWIILLLLLPLFLGGCLSNVDMRQRVILTAVGIDGADVPGHVTITAQLLNALKAPQGDADAVLVISSTGHTGFDAARNMVKEVGRKVFWGQIQAIVIGEEVLREVNAAQLLDFLDRDFEPSRLAYVLVARGQTGAVVMGCGGSMLDSIPVGTITNQVEGVRATGKSHVMRLHDFMRALDTPGRSCATGFLTVTGEKTIGLGEVCKNQKIILEGVATFREGWLVGFWDDKETRGLNWILGEVTSGMLITKDPSEQNKVSLEILGASSLVEPMMVDDQPVIRITVNAEANIGDIVGPGLDILDDGLIASLERRQATVIRNEILAALKRAKDEQTDVFGFGTAFARRFPRQWEKMADSWDEQFLPDLPVELIVEAKIRRVGLCLSPIRVQ